MRSEILNPLHGEVVIVAVGLRRLSGPHLLLEPIDEPRHLRELPPPLFTPPPHLLQLRRDRAKLLPETLPGAIALDRTPVVFSDGGAEGGELGSCGVDLGPQARGVVPYLRDLGPVHGDAVLLQSPQRRPPVLLRLPDLIPRLAQLPQHRLAPGLHRSRLERHRTYG